MKMLTLIVLLMGGDAVGKVPQVTAGPDDRDGAKLVDTPISEVTVFSDRAIIRRVKQIKLEKGIHTLRLSDLPGAVQKDSIRLHTKGGKTLRIQPQSVQRERFSIAQVDSIIEQIERLAGKIQTLNAEKSAIINELTLLNGVSPASPLSEEKRDGRPAVLNPNAWSTSMRFLSQRRQARMTDIQQIDGQIEPLLVELEKLKREAAPYQQGAWSNQKTEVLAIVEMKKSGMASLQLDYTIVGAHWLPRYNIYYDHTTGDVQFESGGVVSQATGEDWSNVKLKLSTSIPGLPIQLPVLKTWTLGEKKEFIPKSKAAKRPKTSEPFASPVQSTTPMQAKLLSEQQDLRERLVHLRQLLKRNDKAVLSVHEKELSKVLSGTGTGGIGSHGSGIGGGGFAKSLGGITTRGSRAYGSGGLKSKGGSKGGAKRGQADIQYQAVTEIDFDSVETDAVLRRPQALMMKRSKSSRRSRVSKKRTGKRLSVSAANQYGARRFHNSKLPAVSADGLDLVWTAPTLATVPSDGKHIKVALASKRLPVNTFYEATPSLQEVAYLKASVTNKSKKPILYGDANIFVGNDFAGQGILRTTGSGGNLELPLGADEDIRLKRTIVPKQRTEGLFSKEDITVYTVKIEAVNHKDRSVSLRLWDQIPKTDNEKIKIQQGNISPGLADSPNEDGIMKWDLVLKPGQKQVVEFTYTITRPANWRLWGI